MAVVTGETACSDDAVLWSGHAPFGDADYSDVFTVVAADAASRSPEQWARSVLEGSSWPMRTFLRFGWRYGLGFTPARANAVLGWPKVAEADGRVVLQQQSWLFGVALLMVVTDNRVSWATRVKYRSPLAPITWMLVGVIHRRFAPRALRRAARSIR